MRLLVCLALFSFSTAATAQYGVNWPTQPKDKLATGIAPGPQALRISGVNDFLYSYQVNIVEIETPTTIPQPAFDGTGAVGTRSTCTTAAITTFGSDAQSASTAYNKLFPSSPTAFQSLTSTQSAWQSTVQGTFAKMPDESTAAQSAFNALTDADQRAACQPILNAANTVFGTLTAANAKLNQSPHVVVANFTAKACKSEILTIDEKYNGIPTGQSVTVQLDAECNKFTVSGGVLLSQIQNRTYTSTTSPAGSGNFLSVGGKGRYTPTLTSLFNFNIPWPVGGHKFASAAGDLRLGISSGPVVHLSSSEASSFGWFAGGTVSFFHLLYITPGEHFGEFADYPVGFTAPGQTIPSGFGQLTPVKRWTGRFGFAITFRGWDVSKATQGGSEKPAASK
jgi:hypothetical protein